MGLWDVSVRLGAEIGGIESDCVRSKLGPSARMPEAGYGEPPEYRARGLTLYRIEASSVEEAGSNALARVRAAAGDCNVHLEPEVRLVSASLSASSGGPTQHGHRAAAVKDPGSFAVAQAIRKRKRKRK